jgi:hypothetical protein
MVGVRRLVGERNAGRLAETGGARLTPTRKSG